MNTPHGPSSRRLSLAALGIALSACATSPDPRAPGELVELFDQLAPDGALEIEFERDGRFGDLEAEVPVDTVPDFVRAAVDAAHPGARIVAAEREFQDGAWTWEVGFEDGDGGVQVVVDGTGAILETERELSPSEAPEAVLRAAERAIPSSNLVSLDVVTSESAEEYHVKRERGGARYKVVLTPEGAVLRRVREARAEIEIPVRD